MDEKMIVKLKKLFDDIIHISEDGEMEFWYARELQPLLGYSRWENFELVIKKAMVSCENAGGNPVSYTHLIVTDNNGTNYLMGDKRRGALRASGDGATTGASSTARKQNTLHYTCLLYTSRCV